MTHGERFSPSFHSLAQSRSPDVPPTADSSPMSRVLQAAIDGTQPQHSIGSLGHGQAAYDCSITFEDFLHPEAVNSSGAAHHSNLESSFGARSVLSSRQDMHIRDADPGDGLLTEDIPSPSWMLQSPSAGIVHSPRNFDDEVSSFEEFLRTLGINTTAPLQDLYPPANTTPAIAPELTILRQEAIPDTNTTSSPLFSVPALPCIAYPIRGRLNSEVMRESLSPSPSGSFSNAVRISPRLPPSLLSSTMDPRTYRRFNPQSTHYEPVQFISGCLQTNCTLTPRYPASLRSPMSLHASSATQAMSRLSTSVSPAASASRMLPETPVSASPTSLSLDWLSASTVSTCSANRPISGMTLITADAQENSWKKRKPADTDLSNYNEEEPPALAVKRRRLLYHDADFRAGQIPATMPFLNTSATSPTYPIAIGARESAMEPLLQSDDFGILPSALISPPGVSDPTPKIANKTTGKRKREDIRPDMDSKGNDRPLLDTPSKCRRNTARIAARKSAQKDLLLMESLGAGPSTSAKLSSLSSSLSHSPFPHTGMHSLGPGTPQSSSSGAHVLTTSTRTAPCPSSAVIPSPQGAHRKAEHYALATRGGGGARCVCGATFVRISDLYRHLRRKKADEQWPCPVCRLDPGPGNGATPADGDGRTVFWISRFDSLLRHMQSNQRPDHQRYLKEHKNEGVRSAAISLAARYGIHLE